MTEIPPNPKLGDVYTNPVDNAEMVFIPAGDFLMGDSDQKDNPRTVNVPGFWIYKNLVTVGQYENYCAAEGKPMPKPPTFERKWTQRDRPMVRVTWNDAVGYCRWAGVRLPTDAEWEKAARGTDGRLYPWGDTWDATRLRCSKIGFSYSGGTAAVGSFPSGASPYGVLDMAGNVWQWCSDWCEKEIYRSLRGGSWNNVFPSNFRCAYRHGRVPDVKGYNIGFRCATG